MTNFYLKDAHNDILNFDPEKKTSFFAVYDGHGGKFNKTPINLTTKQTQNYLKKKGPKSRYTVPNIYQTI